MNKTRTLKTAIFATALALCLTAAFACLSFGGVKTAKADVTASSPSYYFGGIESSAMQYGESGAEFTVSDGDVLTLTHDIVINDASFTLVFPEIEKFGSVTLTLKTSSYYVNGNKVVTGTGEEEITTFEKEINTEIKITGASVSINDNDTGLAFADTQIEIPVSVDAEGYITVGSEKSAQRVRNVGGTVAQAQFTFELAEGEQTAKFAVKAIDQKNGDTSGNFEQSFVKTEDDKLVEASPVLVLSDSLYTKTGKDAYTLNFRNDKVYTIDFTLCSVLGTANKSDVTLTTDSDKNWTKEDTRKVQFYDSATTKISFVKKAEEAAEGEEQAEDIIYAEFTVNIVDPTKDETAPVYIEDNQEAIEAFENALKEQYYDADGGHSVALGTTIDIPSFEDLVADETTPYSEMSHTLYYAGPNSTSFTTSSNLTITLNNAKTYAFYVLFEDACGNKMDAEDFVKEDEENSDVNVKAEKYGGYVFDFVVQDDAPIEVKKGTSGDGNGYRGVSYTASAFKLDAVNCTVTYKLYYNKDLIAAFDPDTAEDDGWVEIPSASSVTDELYEKDGYTYDEIKDIDYNGELSFTPDKLGSYAILCTATSKVSSRTDSEYVTIRIKSEPKIVRPDTHWLQNNLLSVIFLSVGGLCLIGIIVLLCIPPKKEEEK